MKGRNIHYRWMVVIGLSFIMCQMSFNSAVAQNNLQARKMVRHGNRQFWKGKRQDALVTYYKGLNADSTDARVNYNLATAMFPDNWKMTQQAQRDSMIQRYAYAAENETNPLRKSKAFHNTGVLYQSAGDFANAIEAYKEALRNNPNDDESRYNLVVCQHQLKNNNNGGSGNNNQDNQDQNQDQQQQQQNQDQQQQNQDQDQQDQQQDPPMDRETAERMLDAAMQREKQTQRRVNEQQQKTQRRRIEKNW